MGKIIYETKGSASEYGKYGFSAYLGCSCMCSYCYNKKGRSKGVLGGNIPTLKKCFKDETHALNTFQIEMQHNIDELRKHGLFFSFTTDPMLPETIDMTIKAADICFWNKIPVFILSKCSWWTEIDYIYPFSSNVAFGFTLTGHDELEPGASTNQERIEAMRKLHEAGFKTWASIEPIIDFDSSYRIIYKSIEFCDLYKIGLMSGKKYDISKIKDFISNINSYYSYFPAKIYFKDSLLKQAGIDRKDLPSNCVSRDFNLFNT